jgi:hypothetical protein
MQLLKTFFQVSIKMDDEEKAQARAGENDQVRLLFV